MERIKLYAIRRFHYRALNEYLNLRNKTNKCTCIKCVLSHITDYQYVSIAFAMVILMIICILITLVSLSRWSQKRSKRVGNNTWQNIFCVRELGFITLVLINIHRCTLVHSSTNTHTHMYNVNKSHTQIHKHL
jgi:hypothetical protein